MREIKVDGHEQIVEKSIFKSLKKSSKEEVFAYIPYYNECFKGFTSGDYFYFKGEFLFFRAKIEKEES